MVLAVYCVVIKHHNTWWLYLYFLLTASSKLEDPKLNSMFRGTLMTIVVNGYLSYLPCIDLPSSFYPQLAALTCHETEQGMCRVIQRRVKLSEFQTLVILINCEVNCIS